MSQEQSGIRKGNCWKYSKAISGSHQRKRFEIFSLGLELNLLLNIYDIIRNAEHKRIVIAVHFCAIHRNLILWCELVCVTQ
jgi:hypothetical protein